MATKSQMAALVRSGIATETFQHQTLGHFNVSLLRDFVLTTMKNRLPLRKCRFDEVRFEGTSKDALSHLFGAREIDMARVKELTKWDLKEPLIFLACPPGTNGDQETHLLVDGVHRMYALRERGYATFTFYLLPLSVAPMIDETQYRHLPWGEKEVVPGVGLVKRSR